MSSHFLIPIDFSETTLNALKFASQLSKSDQDTFTLLHVIKQEDERIAAKHQLDSIIEKSSIPEGTITGKIIVGKFLNDIGKIAESINASLIVMGTHGSTGLQKVFGSNAMKVVSHSKTPLLIVQEHSVFHAIKKIILTIDLEKESIQVVKYAAKIGELFNAEICLVGGLHTDEMLKRKVDTNILLCKKHLNERGIKYSVELLETKNFEKNLIEFCSSFGADMLAATYYQNTFQIFSEKFVQTLSTNELNIPLLTIDNESISSGSQYSFLSI
jgi:nucleotide-binding universal stress UspA family protein